MALVQGSVHAHMDAYFVSYLQSNTAFNQSQNIAFFCLYRTVGPQRLTYFCILSPYQCLVFSFLSMQTILDIIAAKPSTQLPHNMWSGELLFLLLLLFFWWGRGGDVLLRRFPHAVIIIYLKVS